MTENATPPRTEVVEESKERLEVLELKRTPRPEKLAREQALMEGASEIHYAERAFRPHHETGLDEIRKRVDALAPKKRALPDVPPAPKLEPQPATRAPVIAKRHKTLEKAAPGTLVRVETLVETDAGEAVEAFYESGGVETSRMFLLKDGKPVPVEDVASKVDALPAPTRVPVQTSPAPETAKPKAEKPTEVPEKKRRFGLGRAKETPPKAPAPAEAPDEKKETRSRFGLGRKKETPAPEPSKGKDVDAAPPAKKRFGLRRK